MHTEPALTVTELAQLHAAGVAFTLLDVRRDIARSKDGTEIAGGQWCNPALWLDARFLDGGMTAWQAAGLPTVQAV